MISPFQKIIEELNSGNYSEEYTEEVKNYALNLESKALPIIFTTEHFSILMGRNPRHIRNLIKDRDFHYNIFKIKKKSGGHRWIMAPSDELKHAQHWIKEHILSRIKLHDSATGFVEGISIKENAAPHVNSEIVLNVDLYRFFDTIDEKRVFGIFKAMGYHPNLCLDLARLLTTVPPKKYWKDIKKENKFRKIARLKPRGILPQGSPASPAISNIVCFRLDKRISALTKKLGCNYTRYVDDITISGMRDVIPSLQILKRVIRSEGFYINNNKVKYLTRAQRQEVTGITINKGVYVKSEFKKMVATHLYFSVKYGPDSHLKRLHLMNQEEIKSNFKQWLWGCICFIYSIEPPLGCKMKEQFSKINWPL